MLSCMFHRWMFITVHAYKFLTRLKKNIPNSLFNDYYKEVNPLIIHMYILIGNAFPSNVILVKMNVLTLTLKQCIS